MKLDKEVHESVIDKMTLKSDEDRLIYGVRNGDLDFVKSAFEKGIDINKKIKNRTILSYICNTYNPQALVMIETCLKFGANPNIKDAYGDTPLFVSIKHRQTAIVKLLLENGADIYITNRAGKTALEYSKSYRMDSILVKYADDDKLSSNKETYFVVKIKTLKDEMEKVYGDEFYLDFYKILKKMSKK